MQTQVRKWPRVRDRRRRLGRDSPVTKMDDDLGPRTTLPTNDEADAAESSEDEDAVDWTKVPYVCYTNIHK